MKYSKPITTLQLKKDSRKCITRVHSNEVTHSYEGLEVFKVV